MTDEDMAVYRAILDASRIVAEEMPDMEEMSVSYKRLRDAFEREDWDVFEDIERGTGGTMRAEVRRQAREAAMREIVQAVADLSPNSNDLCDCWHNEAQPLSEQRIERWIADGRPHRAKCVYAKARALLANEGSQP